MAITLGDTTLDWITIVKVALAFVVVALNYIFCKILVFRKR